MKRNSALPSWLSYRCVAIALACIGAGACPHAGASSSANYRIDFYTVSSGGDTLRGSCFRVSGSTAQPAPGYSSGGVYAVIAGYWQPPPLVATDEIFYSGFEGC